MESHIPISPFTDLAPSGPWGYDPAVPNDELIPSIAPYVMKCLARSSFFEKLDDLLRPVDALRQRDKCDGTFKLSEAVLTESGFDRAELPEIIQVLSAKGACCDCEVLYNVAESSRLKAAHWRSQGAGQASHNPHKPPIPD